MLWIYSRPDIWTHNSGKEIQIVFTRQHTGEKCFGKKAFKCQKSHNALLHLNKNNGNLENGAEDWNKNNTTVVAHLNVLECEQLLLSTAVVIFFSLIFSPNYLRSTTLVLTLHFTQSPASSSRPSASLISLCFTLHYFFFVLPPPQIRL